MLLYVLDRNNVSWLKTAIIEQESNVDGFEFRLDCLYSLKHISLLHLRSLCKKPVLFTLRSKREGGNFSGDFFSEISQYLCLKPEFLDIEPEVSDASIDKIHSQCENIKLIRSYHNFKSTPTDLDLISKQLYHPKITYYKIVCHASNLNDAIRLLLWKNKKKEMTSFSMGPFGGFSRLYGKKLRNPLLFTGDSHNKVSGFLPVNRWMEKGCQIQPRSKIYLVIGNPLKNSISDQVYTKLFKRFSLDAFIEKIEIDPFNFKNQWKSLMKLDIAGCIVTMPFKNHFCSFPINTIKFNDKSTSFFSTDGKAVFSLIQEKKSAKSLLIIGTGATAQSISIEAQAHGVRVMHLSRSKNRDSRVIRSDQVDLSKFDAIINATPCGMEGYPIQPDLPLTFSKDVLMVDVVYQKKETAFISNAKKMGCDTICGKEMFIRQGALQFSYLFDMDWKQVNPLFAEYVQKILNA